MLINVTVDISSKCFIKQIRQVYSYEPIKKFQPDTSTRLEVREPVAFLIERTSYMGNRNSCYPILNMHNFLSWQMNC